MKPVILVIENSVDRTGGLNSILRNAITLQDTFHFHFILPEGSKSTGFVESSGFRVVQLPMLEINRSLKNILLYFPRLIRNTYRIRRLIRQFQVDLIISNDFYNMLAPAYNLIGGRVPYITFVRFIPDRFPKPLLKFWFYFHFRFAQRIVAVSNVVKQNIAPNPKVDVIYNEKPIDSDFKYYELDPDSKVILYVSNYIPGKGLEYAVRAFAALPEKFHDWKLRFVGNDMGLRKNALYKKMLRDLADELNVSSRIEWKGFSTDVVQEYRQAAVILNFSDSESFSLTCMEAMYVGRPVIATRCGGPEEMITSGHDGELVDRRDVSMMTVTLQKLLLDAQLRKNYGIRAHKTISEKFSIENTIQKLIPILNSAIKGTS